MKLKEEYFQLIKDAGFDSVRIPVRWSAHCLSDKPYTIEPAFFKRVDWAVRSCLSRGLRVVLNIHHYHGLCKQPARHKERYLAIWKQIAEHYKDYPDALLFEFLNEPSKKLKAELWNQFVKETLSVVRRSNPQELLWSDRSIGIISMSLISSSFRGGTQISLLAATTTVLSVSHTRVLAGLGATPTNGSAQNGPAHRRKNVMLLRTLIRRWHGQRVITGQSTLANLELTVRPICPAGHCGRNSSHGRRRKGGLAGLIGNSVCASASTTGRATIGIIRFLRRLSPQTRQL